jgi:hypothetical protein
MNGQKLLRTLRGCLAGIGLTVSSSAAFSSTDKEMESLWIVDTSNLPTHVKAVQGRTLISIPIRPSKLIVLKEKALDSATGDTRSVSGNIFFLNSSDHSGQTYCSTKSFDQLVDKLLLHSYPWEFLCLIDKNFDFVFDQWYRRRSILRSSVPFLPNGQTVPDGDLSPTRYEFASEEMFDRRIELTILRKSGSLSKGHIYLGVRFDAYKNKVRDSVETTPWMYVPSVGGCGTLAFLNIDLNFCQGELKNSIDLKIRKTGRLGVIRIQGDMIQYGSMR